MGDTLLGGRYRLVERLGTGGMSVVWRAHDEVLGRDVAVKVLAPELAADDPDLPHRIRDEARAAARLHHPNVVAVHDYGDAGDSPYIVMELVDGRTLDDQLAGGPLPWREAAEIAAQVAAALTAAHERGIVHRDVKPGNVMLAQGAVKLVDFGVSATVDEPDSSGAIVLGTPAYLAPERIEGGPVRPATDVYALGLLLYRMLAGRLPWSGSTITQMLVAHLYKRPDELPAISGLPDEVAELCRRCLAKNPAERVSAAEAGAALRRALDGGVGPVPTAPTVPANPRRVREPTAPMLVDAPMRALRIRTLGLVPGLAAAWRNGTGRPRSRRQRAVAGLAALAIAGSASAVLAANLRDPGTTVPATAAGPGSLAAAPGTPAACTVRYQVLHVVDDRLLTAVTLVNTGRALDGWQLTFPAPEGQSLLRGWSEQWSQAGSAVRATGEQLPAGGTIATGFDATYAGTPAPPDRFELNGVRCEAEVTIDDQGKSAGSEPARAAAAAEQSDPAPHTGPGAANPGSAGANSGPAAAKKPPKPASKADPKPKHESDDEDEDEGDDD